MSWYRDNDGKIITDDEFQSACCECSAFCSEGTISVSCNGERSDCPHYKEVDTSEYDNRIIQSYIDKVVEELTNLQKCEYELSPIRCHTLDVAKRIIRKDGVDNGVCKWKMDNVGASIGCRGDLHHTGYVNYKECPYCGRKIKVVEE